MNFDPRPLDSGLGAFLLAFPALFSIVNPVGTSLTFFSVTADRTHVERVALAREIAIYATFILVGSLCLGGYILNFFGISLGALRVAGGLVVGISAWELLMAPEAREDRKESDAAPAANRREDVAFFPLTMPFTTGPGSISVAVALAAERPSNGAGVLPFFAGVSAAAVAIAVLVFLFYSFADRVLSVLGEAGARIVTRLAAFLLLCIGVQILSNGVESLIRPLLVEAGVHLHSHR